MVLSNTAVPKFYGEFRDKVQAGEIPVNYWVSLEMNRIDFLIDSPDYYYDEDAIDGYVNFCNNELTITNGDPLELLDTFKLWSEQLLGWYYFVDEEVYNPDTRQNEIQTIKRRLTQIQYLIIGRGAAKSVYQSTHQMYGAVADKETTQQWVIAPRMYQAEETMAPIRTALIKTPGPLLKFLTQGSVLSNGDNKIKMASTKKGIQNFITNSLIEIRPMSIDKVQGGRSKYNSIDEWLSGNTRENVIGAVVQGASKIDDFWVIATSSEGTVRDGVGDTVKLELMDILNGKYFAPHISIWYYRLDDISEVNMPEMWLKANPNLGATVSYDAYKKDVERAEAFPSERNDILAKRFGIPVEGATYYFTYEETLLHKWRNYSGMLCSVGFDGSQGDDFTAFTLLFPLGGDRFGIKARAYVSKYRKDKLPEATQYKYEQLEAEGSLVIMDEAILDQDLVWDDFLAWMIQNDYIPVSMGYDVYNSDVFVRNWLATYGEYNVIKVRQGFRVESVPLGEIKNLARNRLLLFDQELMKFSMGNAVALQDNSGNQKLDKRRQEEKIDNVAALIDAWVAFKSNKEVFA